MKLKIYSVRIAYTSVKGVGMIREGLDFEKPVIELENKIEELKQFSSGEQLDLAEEIKKLEKKLRRIQRHIYNRLTPWQRVQLARHPKRPHALDFIKLLLEDFVEFHGDRLFAEDRAIVGGMARFEGISLIVIGHQKGKDTKENILRNFGMPHPEGYRKALRLMKMAEKFNKPVLTLIDTPGAYPGIGAEERGQAEAIAKNLREMALLKAPILVVVTGEGGSGGALGIGVGDRILMLENAVYSVISPEGCAAILWNDSSKAPDAAETMRVTAQEIYKMGLIEEIIREPMGGAHRNQEEVATHMRTVIKRHLDEIMSIPMDQLLLLRYEKYRKMGVFSENSQ